MVTFLPKEKHTKSGLVTWIGQLALSATNCTRPVGAWQICCKKFCSRVSMRRAEIFRQARTLAPRSAATQVASRSRPIFILFMKTKLAESSSDTIREEVRQRYGATARGESCADDCCTSTSSDVLGYSAEDSAFAPEAANLGLGCGNPLAIASLERGQTVLDLGSGAGFDCFLAARAMDQLEK